MHVFIEKVLAFEMKALKVSVGQNLVNKMVDFFSFSQIESSIYI